MTTQLLQNEQETVELDGKTQYLNFIKQWKQDINVGSHADEYDHLYFIINRNVLRKTPKNAAELVEELKAAFGPVSNSKKLANGRRPYDTLEDMLWRAGFHGLVQELRLGY